MAKNYLELLEFLYDQADYFTINISSPNTKGLRSLLEIKAFVNLAGHLQEKISALNKQSAQHKLLFFKLAPDLEPKALADLAKAALDLALDGVILTNSTIMRPLTLSAKSKQYAGGLSGKPLAALSNQCLKEFTRLSQGKITIIAVGGIFNGFDLYQKIRLGATLGQIYSALIFQGVGVTSKIIAGLERQMLKDGFKNLAEIRGIDV